MNKYAAIYAKLPINEIKRHENAANKIENFIKIIS